MALRSSIASPPCVLRSAPWSRTHVPIPCSNVQPFSFDLHLAGCPASTKNQWSASRRGQWRARRCGACVMVEHDCWLILIRQTCAREASSASLFRSTSSGSRRLSQDDHAPCRCVTALMDAKPLLHMKLLKVIGDYVRRGGAQSTSSMRVIIGEVVFSHNIDFHDRNEASTA